MTQHWLDLVGQNTQRYDIQIRFRNTLLGALHTSHLKWEVISSTQVDTTLSRNEIVIFVEGIHVAGQDGNPTTSLEVMARMTPHGRDF